MIKTITLYTIPEGADPDETWRWNTEVHAADFKKIAGSRLKKYVLNRVTNAASGAKPPFFVMVETWWDSEEVSAQVVKEGRSFMVRDGVTLSEDFRNRVASVQVLTVQEKVIK